jgi:hypothetical protein
MIVTVFALCNVVGAEEITDGTVPDTETGAVEEVPSDAPPDTSEETPTDTITDETITEVGTEIYNTIFTRIFEFIEYHKDTIIMVLGFCGSIVITLQEIKRKKKTDNGMDEKQTQVLSNLAGITNSQNGVVDVVNALINGYEQMKNKYTEYESAEDDRNKLVGAVMVQNEAILEILATVYANSNLPRGVKDLISLKYAHCVAALDEDEKLKACVLAVKDAMHESDEDGAKEA